MPNIFQSVKRRPQVKPESLPNQPNVNPDLPGFDPNDPWGYATGSVRNDTLGSIQRLIGAHGRAGAFAPGGSPAILNMLRERGYRDLRDTSAGAANAARFYGGDDPFAASMAATDAFTRGSLGVNDNLNDAALGLATDAQDFGRDVLQDELDNARGTWRYGLESAERRSEGRAQRRGNLGQTLGGIAGAGLGALVRRQRRTA